jgi:acetylornithine deacetylase/succinyl-diaminopimelate desuccinylase-like protein
MSSVQQAVQYLTDRREANLADLKEILSIPSISTLPENQPDMQRAAEWLAGKLKRIGIHHVEIMPTGGHPVVYGDWLEAPGQPTVLIYGHYDVQPVDPLDEWQSSPFEPTVRGESLYARGATDMKGQLVAALEAVEALLQTTGALPLNVKFMLEGEEEIGSEHLGEFVKAQADRLRCDVSLNADAMILRPDMPSLVHSLRGLAYFELWVHGSEHDLHSGLFGGSVHNPAIVLSELIAGMHDADGRITLPGFYDRVRALTPEERAAEARLPHDDETWRVQAGSPPALYGEKGYTTLERVGARPTLDVNGLYSGFIAEGSKTVLPAKAMAKISMRLVPDQVAGEVVGQLEAYLRAHAPATVTWELKDLNACEPAIIERNSAYVQAAAAALQTVFGVEPVFLREGGSVPVVSMVQSLLGVESVLLGFGLPDDNLHAPNEKLFLPNFYKGMETYVHFFVNAAEGNGAG